MTESPSNASRPRAPAGNIIYFVANGVFSESLAGGDINFMRMAAGATRAGYQVVFVGGHALRAQLARCGERYPVLLTDRRMVGFHTPDTAWRQWRLLADYAGRALQTVWRLRSIARTSLVYAVTAEWQDSLPAMLSRARRQCLMLHMLCPTLREVFFSDRVDIASSRVAALHYWLGQSLPLFLFRFRRHRLVFYQSPLFLPRLRSLGYKPTDLHHVPGGIDVTVADQVPEQEIQYDVVWVGRYHRQKGIEDLLECLSHAAQQLPAFRALIIGDVQDRLEPRIRERRLTQNVHFAGFVTGLEKFRFFKSARLFLMPSHHESYGFVIGEALASGLPVVAYDLPAYRPIFGDLLTYVPAFDRECYKTTVVDRVARLRRGEGVLDADQTNAFKRAVSWENAQGAFVRGLAALQA